MSGARQERGRVSSQQVVDERVDTIASGGHPLTKSGASA